MPTEMELTLEQTQQGVSYEVSNIRVTSITLKMEILLEPISNKLMVDPHEFEGIFKDGDGGKGPNWLFDLDYLTNSKNYQPVTAENKANKTAGPKEANHSAGNSEMEAEPAQEYFVLPLWSSYTSTVKSSKAKNGGEKPNGDTGAARATICHSVRRPSYPNLTNNDQDDSQIPALEDIYDNPSHGIFTNESYDDEGAVADFTNFETTVNVSSIPTSRIHTIHPQTQILGDPNSTVQTRSKVNKSYEAHALISYIQKQRRNNHKDFQHCLFACFLSQIEPKKISEALADESWVDAMQEELLQFKIHTKNKDERVLVVRNKQDRVPLVMATIDMRSVCVTTTGLLDPNFPKKVYKVVKAPVRFIHQAPKAWKEPRMNIMVSRRFTKHEINFVLQRNLWCNEFEGIEQEADSEFRRKFYFAKVKTANTPIETQKPLIKGEEAADVDVHLYRSMIGSLVYLTAARPDIMFAVCAYSRRLISWQCKKQTFVATSTTEVEYVAAANCCGQGMQDGKVKL
ncbi:hypothetical protein Tco_1377703 [Tanacetum coccineum]